MATQKSTSGKSTASKTTVKKTAGKQTAQNKKKATGKKVVKKKTQRREIWVVGTFFAAFLLMLAIFGVEGFLLTGLRLFIR